MKNRKREICTSGSARDEAGQPPHLLGPDDLKYVVGQMMRRCGYDLVD